MATFSEWVEGARLRTLPAAAAPVIVGTAAAWHVDPQGFSWARAILAFIVAEALQIGVNYSNDYSDGIRGTDENRTGPARLTGGGLARPGTVLAAALGCFALAGLAGIALLWLSGQWILLVAGILAVAAAWFYTGGRTPYGYMGIGLSELLVFVFFGLMACVGTTWTQVQSAPWWLWVSASALGLLSIGLLMANNIRDIPTDTESGKKTIPVRLGDRASRRVYGLCLFLPVVALGLLVAAVGLPAWTVALVVVLAAVGAWIPMRPMAMGATGRDLIPSLRDTGLFTLAWGTAAAVVLVIA